MSNQVRLSQIALILLPTAQVFGTSGFLIQSLAGNRYPAWNHIMFACFIIGVVSSTILLKEDIESCYDSFPKRITNNKKESEITIQQIELGKFA